MDNLLQLFIFRLYHLFFPSILHRAGVVRRFPPRFSLRNPYFHMFGSHWRVVGRGCLNPFILLLQLQFLSEFHLCINKHPGGDIVYSPYILFSSLILSIYNPFYVLGMCLGSVYEGEPTRFRRIIRKEMSIAA